jgi:replication factor C subunit 1
VAQLEIQSNLSWSENPIISHSFYNLIQENYLNYKPSAASRDGDGSLRMDLIARAAESIADGDIINVQIRRYRQWQHSQMGAFASSIIP